MKSWGKIAVLTTFAVLGSVLALPSPVSAETQGITQVVQLGDSYSAGYGVLSNYRPATGGACLQSGFFDTSVVPGGRLATQLGVPLEFQACGGAEIGDVVDQFRTARSSIAGDGTGTLVVLTAGGNDLRTARGEMWPDLLQRCILWDLSCERRSLNQVANLTAVANDMAALVDEIATSASGAHIRVLGYPEIMQRSPWCFGVTGIDHNEADFIDAAARELNDNLEAAVDSVAARRGGNIEFVDVEDAFDDHGACQTERSGQRYVNDTVFVPWSVTVAANSFHPTASGYEAYSLALNASLPQHLQP